MENSPRIIAIKTLLRIERGGAFSNILLDRQIKSSNMKKEDRALFSALVMGVLERRITLDYNISLYLTRDIKRLKPEVLTILRVGAYQILFSDRIPNSAAVNESVKAAVKLSCPYAKGLINAVLRKVSENGLVLPKDEDRLKVMSVSYSVPLELAQLITESLGYDGACKFLETAAGKAKTEIRVNTLKTNTETLIQILENEGVKAERHPILEDALLIQNEGGISSLKSFNDGLFHIQGISSQLVVKALSLQLGDTVLDMCAAPGGKSFTAAQYLKGKSTVYSFDLTENRVSLIKSGAKRLGIENIKCGVNDAAVYNENISKAECVLCDVPCSGLGVIRKKPEIRYKQISGLDSLYALQYNILSTSSCYVKDKGTLLYSTCTINPKENKEIVIKFLENHPEFSPVKVLPEIEALARDGDFLTLLPHINNCDGFFIAKFIKG
ncbi:MAG TPA: 16S rRNA (cytosine(967)-C(5))-methyltransferase RsmB [Oscillospiraceae bacterium]|nr:16S rRNA (cytosine(967)-C(5))-methyltransferase RsmB [Oscillospiraceae bacterium]